MKMTPFFVAWKLWKVGLLSLCCATVQAKERRCSGLLSWEAQRREYSSGRFSQLFKVKTPPLPSSAIEKWFCSSPALILGKFLYVTWQREEPPAEQHSVCLNHSGYFIIGSDLLKQRWNKTQKNWVQDRSKMLLRLLTLKNSLSF